MMSAWPSWLGGINKTITLAIALPHDHPNVREGIHMAEKQI
jgi:hypothetical protein